LPNSIMTYEGLHDVSTNTPTLTDAGGDAGQVYRVSVGGTRDYGSGSITLNVGDYLIHNGSVWQFADTTDAVSSVNGFTGAVTLTKSDVGLGNVDNTSDATKLATAVSRLVTTTAISAYGSLELTTTSTRVQVFTGSGEFFTVTVPNFTTTSEDCGFVFYNRSADTIIVQTTFAADVGYLPPAHMGEFFWNRGNALLSGGWTARMQPMSGPDILAFVDGDLGTPSSVTLSNATGLPVSGITGSATADITLGTIHLGHASDTTITRSAAGIVAVEGVNLVNVSASQTLTNKTLSAPTFTGAITPDTTSASSAGYLGMPANSQSAAYPLVASDAGKMILHPSTDNNPRTFTIPANATVPYPVGTVITFVNAINTVTIAITTDTLTLAGQGTTGSRTLAANGIATAIKTGATTWLISGNGLT
jgi:hypothetical protein